MKHSCLLRAAALLCLCLMLVSAAACGNTEVPSDQGGTTAATEAVADTNTEAAAPADTEFVQDNIPADLKLNTTLTMLYWSDVENVEFFVEESTGDMVSDSIWTRNIKVEERLGVKFEYIGTPGNYENNAKFVTAAKTAKANGDAYDLYAAYSMTTASLAFNGLCRDLLKYDILDFSYPWWPDGLITEAKICDKLFCASGDLSTNMLYMLYPIYFNKDLISSYNLENPYTLVKNNQWTIDKMFEMAAAADTNGSSAGGSQVLGMAQASTVHTDAYFYSAGMRTVDRDADGHLVISDLFHSDVTNTLAEKMQEYMHKPYVSISDTTKAFANGLGIFILDRARYASKHLGSADFEYGVVPVPKYSPDQENFVTCLGYPYTLYAITDSSTQPEAAAAALQCLGSEGYRTITPALFEITMKSRYVSDNEAAQMFDIIRSTASFDVGRIYTSQLDNLPYSLFRSYVNGTNTTASYAANFNGAKKRLDKMLSSLEETFAGFEG